MSLASLTVDLTLGLAKFESDSGKAAQIVARDQEKMSRAALTLQRALERQADQATKTNAELQTIKAASLGLGDDIISKIPSGGGAFAAIGTQGTAAFKAIGAAASAAAGETDKLLATAVAKIREVNEQAKALKAQAISQNDAKTLTDDGLKVRLAQINEVRQATLKQINDEFTRDKQAQQAALAEIAAGEARRASAQKIIDAQNGLTATYRSQLAALRELRDAGNLTPAQFKQAGTELVGKNPAVQQRQQEAAAAKALQDQELASAEVRRLAAQKLIDTQNGLTASYRQQLIALRELRDRGEITPQQFRQAGSELVGKNPIVQRRQEEAAASKAAADAEVEAGQRFIESLRQRIAAIGQTREAQQALEAARLGVSDEARRLIAAQGQREFIVGIEAEIDRVRQLTAEFGKTTTEVLQLKAAQLGVFGVSAEAIQELKVAQQVYDNIAGAAKRAAAAKAADEGFAAKIQQQIAEQRQLAAEFGKTETEILQLQAAERGLGESLAPAIAQLKALKEANAAAGIGTVPGGVKNEADEFIRGLVREREEIGKTREELLLLRAARAGVDPNVARREVTANSNAEFVAGIEAQIAAQERLNAEFGKTEAEILALRAAERGLADQTAASQAKLQSLKAAGAAQTQAKQTSTDNDAFINSLEREINAIGKTRAELIALDAAQRGLTERAAPLVARLAEAEANMKKYGVAAVGAGAKTKITQYEIQTLNYTLSDVVASLASGISPTTILLQQGGQVRDVFGSFGAVFQKVATLFTPVRVAIGGAAAAVGALAFAFITGRNESKAFADSLVLTGNYAGITEAQYNKLAKGIAASGQVSIASAREFTQALISTGQVGPQALSQAAEAAARYGAATGKSAKEVATEFAALNNDVYGGAKKLNETLNFLTLSQLKQIQALEEQGKAADAQGIIYDALNARLKGLEPNLGTLDRILRGVSNTWKGFWDAAYDIGRTETIDDKIAKIEAKLKGFQERQKSAAQPGEGFQVPGLITPPVGPSGAERLRNERDGLLREKQQQAQAAYLAGLSAQTAKEGVAAQEYVDGYLKRGKALDAYTKEVAKANVEFERLARAGNPVSAANQALILKKIKEDFTDKPAQNDAAAARKAQLDQDLKLLKDNLQQEQDALAFGQNVLTAIYAGGTVSLRDFYDTKRAIISAGVEAELIAVGKEQARLQAELAKGGFKDEAEKIRVQTLLNESREKGGKIARDAARAGTIANFEEAAAVKALNERVDEYRASVLQLQGDELSAARVRAALQVQSARELAARSDGQISEDDLSRQARAIALANDFAEVQRRTSVATADLARSEESFTLRATQNGASLLEQEQGIYLIRSTALSQLGELVNKAKELADASSDPRIKAAAADLALQYQKAAESVDPSLTRLREAGNEAGTSLANAFGNAFQKATTFQDLLKGVYVDLLKIGTTKLFTEPLEKFLQGGFRTLIDSKSTTQKYSGTSKDPSAPNYENSFDLAASAVSTLAGSQTTLATATQTQTQIVTQSSSALVTLEASSRAAAAALANVAQKVGVDISKLFGSGNGYTIDYGGSTTNLTGGSLPTAGGAATGTNFVERDMLTIIHKGEAVIPAAFNPYAPTSASRASAVNPTQKYDGGGGGLGSLNQNIMVKNEAGDVAQATARKSNSGDIEILVRKIVRDENGKDLSSGGGPISKGLTQRGVNINGGLARRA